MYSYNSIRRSSLRNYKVENMAFNTTVKDLHFDHISSNFYREIISGTAQVLTASQSGGTGTAVDTLTLGVLRGLFTITDVTIANTSLGTGFFNGTKTGVVYTIAFRINLPQNLNAQPSIALTFESANGAITDGVNFLINSVVLVADQVDVNSFLARAQVVILGSSAGVANTAMLNLLVPADENSARINFVLKLEAHQNSVGIQPLVN